MRLSAHYHLGCDHGTSVMFSWEKGGVAPIYLCDSHAVQIAKTSVGVMAMAPQSAASNNPTEQPKRPVIGPAEAQVETPNKHAAVVTAPAGDFASSDSHKASMNGAVGKTAPEVFETYRPALQGVKASTVTEEKPADRADLERTCISRYGQRCTCDASVHCPKCGRWFCDSHGEDEKWHACALPL